MNTKYRSYDYTEAYEALALAVKKICPDNAFGNKDSLILARRLMSVMIMMKDYYEEYTRQAEEEARAKQADSPF